MKFLVIVSCVFLTSHVKTISCGKPEPTENFPYSAVLDRHDKVWLYWKFNETYITFELHGNTGGWIGVGISPKGGMIGADIYVGWVKNGIAYISDRHGLSSNTFPPKDPEQNVELMEGRECDGWTVIKFQRQIVGCENSYDVTIEKSVTRVIWALGQSDPRGNDIIASDYHGYGNKHRGVKVLTFFESGQPCSFFPNETVETFGLLNDNFAVPPKLTTYNCKLLKLPDLKSKHHIVKIEPIIDNPNLLHHIRVFQCTFDKPQNPEEVGRSKDCNYGSSQDYNYCTVFFAGWTIGFETSCPPAHVGFPIGPGEPQYVILETHFNNPAMKSGIVDNSGLKFHYTNQLREFDAGLMQIDLRTSPYTLTIPPNLERFDTYAECPKECLEDGMASASISKIHIFSVLLHAHRFARQIIIRHISSNGSVEFPTVAEDLSYSFYYQVQRFLPKEIVVNSGDILQAHCIYNSKSRKSFTLGGLGTEREMCKVYIAYYPRIPVERCATSPNIHDIYAYFGVNYNGPNDITYSDQLEDMKIPQSNLTMYDVMIQQNWTQEYSDNFSKHVQHVLRHRVCEGGNQLYKRNFIKLFVPPNITHPYLPPEKKCVQPSSGRSTASLETYC